MKTFHIILKNHTTLEILEWDVRAIDRRDAGWKAGIIDKIHLCGWERHTLSCTIDEVAGE